jgi:uncharacterized protein (TIGR00251 family)
MALLAVHVTPKAARDEVAGWRGSELSVRVTSAPEGGKANAAVCKTVAAALGLPKTSLSVHRGGTSRHKVLDVPDLTEQQIHALLGEPDSALF